MLSDPPALQLGTLPPREIKGDRVLVHDRVSQPGIGRFPIDCRRFNAVHVHAIPRTDGGFISFSVLGGMTAAGPWMRLPWASAQAPGITYEGLLETHLGCQWAMVSVDSISGVWDLWGNAFVGTVEIGAWGPSRSLTHWFGDEVTTVTANGTRDGAPLYGYGASREITVVLNILSKSIDAGTSVDLFVQTDADARGTWDDIARFPTITDTAMPVGQYVARVVQGDVGFGPRPVVYKAIAPGTIRDYFGNTIRVAHAWAGFAGADSVSYTVTASASG